MTGVTDEEMAENCGNAADQMFTICALMAFVDEHLHPKEAELLTKYGKAMGLTDDRAEDLMTVARKQLLHQSAEAIAALPGFDKEKYKALQSIGERVLSSPKELENIAKEHNLVK